MFKIHSFLLTLLLYCQRITKARKKFLKLTESTIFQTGDADILLKVSEVYDIVCVYVFNLTIIF